MKKSNVKVIPQKTLNIIACMLALICFFRIVFILYKCESLYSMGIFYLLTGVGLFSICKNGLFIHNSLNKIVQIILALLFTCAQIIGLYFSTAGIDTMTFSIEPFFWCIMLLPLSIAGLNYFFKLSDKYYHFAQNENKDLFSAKKNFIFGFGIILLGFLIPFLTYFPAIIAYDALPQLSQIYVEGYSSHHPLIHTLMLSAALKIGKMLPFSNSDTIGLAIYTIAQMIIMALCFAYAYVYLCQKKVRKIICYLFLFYIAFWPTHGLLAVAITKDSIFSVFVMMFTIFTYQLIVDKSHSDSISNKWLAMYIIIIVFMLLFRNNSIYAWILFVILFILLSIKKTYLKRVLGSFIIAFFIYFFVNWGMIYFTQATNDTYARETLSVPAQQIARTVAYHEDELTVEEKQWISTIWEGNMPEYVPAIADRSKKDISNEISELDALKKLWIQLGKKYPAEYIIAFLIKNMGLYYMDDTSYLNIYSYAQGYLQISFPYNQQELAHELIPGYKRHQHLQLLQAFYRHFAYGNVIWRYIPFVAVFMQPAFYCWLLLFYCINCIRKNRWSFLTPAVFLISLIGTILLGPCVLIRYMYPIMISTLVLVLIPLPSPS